MLPLMARRLPQPRIAICSSQRAVRIPRKDIAELVEFVAAGEGAPVAEADIAFVDAAEMAALHRRHLGHAGPTDVLSFDLSDADRRGIVAQLVICGDIAAKEAAARGIPPRRELMLYIIHGLLHLMGYEDQSVRGAARMLARQEELLAAFLARPARGRTASRRSGGRKGPKTHG